MSLLVVSGSWGAKDKASPGFPQIEIGLPLMSTPHSKLGVSWGIKEVCSGIVRGQKRGPSQHHSQGKGCLLLKGGL